MEIIREADKSGSGVRGGRTVEGGGEKATLQLIRGDCSPKISRLSTDYGPRTPDYDAVSPGFNTSTSTPAGSTRCLRRSGVPVRTGNVP